MATVRISPFKQRQVDDIQVLTWHASSLHTYHWMTGLHGPYHYTYTQGEVGRFAHTVAPLL